MTVYQQTAVCWEENEGGGGNTQIRQPALSDMTKQHGGSGEDRERDSPLS